MSDAKLSFQDKGKYYCHPARTSPEACKEAVGHQCQSGGHVELFYNSTRNVPFADLSPMEASMQIALESLRVPIPPGTSPHMAKLIQICMNEDPGKTFDMIIPIVEKMQAHTA